jgi:hypothetical protein
MKMLSDESRKRLEVFCPEIALIFGENHKIYYRLLPIEMDALIAASLVRRIQERGELREFAVFLQQRGYATIRPPFVSAGKERYLIDIEVMDPTRLPELVDGWLKGGKLCGQ